MSYKVIHCFEDLQDFNHPYKVGDTFPRLGMVVTEGRLKELSGNKNKQGKALIEEVKEEVLEDSERKYTKTEINRMSTNDLKNLAISLLLPNAEYMNGAELKRVLIEHFNL